MVTIAKNVVSASAAWRAPRNRRALIAVGAVHVALVFALANAAQNTAVERSAGPIEVVMLNTEPDSTREPPAPPRPQIDPPQLDSVIAPAIDLAPEAASTHAITVTLVSEAPPQPAVGTPKLISIIQYVRPPAPRYPRAARSLGQRGLVILRALIDVNGRATEVIVHRSTGYAALDEAARRAVLEAAFKPYEEDGRRQPAFVLIPIEFDPAHPG